MFFRNLRINKHCYFEVLDTLHLEETAIACVEHDPIDKGTCLLMGLWYLASKVTYRELAQLFRVGQGSAHRAVNKVIDAINMLSNQYIIWPANDECSTVEAGFRQKSSLPGIIGVYFRIETIFIHNF